MRECQRTSWYQQDDDDDDVFRYTSASSSTSQYIYMCIFIYMPFDINWDLGKMKNVYSLVFRFFFQCWKCTFFQTFLAENLLYPDNSYTCSGCKSEALLMELFPRIWVIASVLRYQLTSLQNWIDFINLLGYDRET